MSDIVIRNMEMPKECFKNVKQYCLKFYSCSIVKQYLDIKNDTSQVDIYHKRLDGCPLVELPPHGRLIDADKLKKKMGERFSTGSEVGYMWLVDDAPTILEASKA